MYKYISKMGRLAPGKGAAFVHGITELPKEVVTFWN